MIIEIIMEIDGHKKLAVSRKINDFDLDEIARGPVPRFDPWDAMSHMQRMERRKRFVDMIAGDFAHALTSKLCEGRDG